MATLQYSTANTEGIDFDATYTAYDQSAAISSTNSPDNPGPPFQVGTTVKGTGDSDFVFIKATAAVTSGDLVRMSATWDSSGATTSNALFGDLLGVAVASIASGSYGWVQRAGYVTGGVRAVTNIQPNVQLYATTDAGVVSSTSTTGNKTLLGIKLTATASSSAAGTTAILNYPAVGATTT